ncbi:MAG: hypothetical protein M3Z46_00190 [Actinomycetota bacterium]|nr:hypothetical protein [Actinomycetota bacterium]
MNKAAGRCVIPIGRHSLMNRLVACPEQLRTDTAAGAFADQLNTLFTNIDGLRTWAATVIINNLIELGFQGDQDVLLADYLTAARQRSLSVDQVATRLRLGPVTVSVVRDCPERSATAYVPVQSRAVKGFAGPSPR